MYSNPYLNSYNNFPGYPQMQERQQPIQNIFTNQQPMNSGKDFFMAKYLKSGETPQEVFVNDKTALIDLNGKKLYIKELDSNITEYQIILPLDEKDKKIQELENQINELKGMMNNVSTASTTSTNQADTISTEQHTDG